MKASICQGFKILKQLPLEVNCETSYWSWAQNPGLWLAGSCQKVYWPGFENNQTTPFGVTLQTSSSSISPINGWIAIQTLLFLWIKIFAARFFLNVKKLQKYKSLVICDQHHCHHHHHHHHHHHQHPTSFPGQPCDSGTRGKDASDQTGGKEPTPGIEDVFKHFWIPWSSLFLISWLWLLDSKTWFITMSDLFKDQPCCRVGSVLKK